MNPGKTIRLGAWLRGGRTFLAALDEVIPRGIEAAAALPETLAWLGAAGVDGVVLHAGMASRYAGLLAELRLPWVLKLTSNSAWAADRTVRGEVAWLRTALALGAAGVAVNVFIGSPFEKEHLTCLGQAVEQGQTWGMPVIAFINPPADRQFDPAALAYAARIGAEIGADVIKTDYCGDPAAFTGVIAACPVPLLVEDTPLPLTPEGTLSTARGALQAGAAGVLFGRRLWGLEDRDTLAAQLKDLIHRRSEDDRPVS
jgi:fructose-bisphosphate aldolase/2-amino-3,7-dideoxy-D-threo-hept-6-ulosonate synthase